MSITHHERECCERAGGEKREGDEWTLVSPRNRGNKRNLQWRNNNQHSHAAARRVDEVQGRKRTGLHYNDGGVVSYYFTNFPGNYSVEALRRMFAEWGKVVDVFIPTKKNKEGKAFGFVRFKEVQYPFELEKRLDQIWIGTYKIRANWTRFVWNSKGQNQDQVFQTRPKVKQVRIQRRNEVVSGVLFSDVVRGNKGKKV